jgi:hypothetical protein
MPARRYIVSPQGGGPLRFIGATLPAAIMAVPYLQNIASNVSGGTSPYTEALVSKTGADSWTVTPSGTIQGTPLAPNVLTTADGFYLITATQDVFGVEP